MAACIPLAACGRVCAEPSPVPGGGDCEVELPDAGLSSAGGYLRVLAALHRPQLVDRLGLAAMHGSDRPDADMGPAGRLGPSQLWIHDG